MYYNETLYEIITAPDRDSNPMPPAICAATLTTGLLTTVDEIISRIIMASYAAFLGSSVVRTSARIAGGPGFVSQSGAVHLLYVFALQHFSII